METYGGEDNLKQSSCLIWSCFCSCIVSASYSHWLVEMSLVFSGHLDELRFPALIVDEFRRHAMYANTQNMKVGLHHLKFVLHGWEILRTYFMIRKRYVCFS